MMLRKVNGLKCTYEYQYDGRAPFKEILAWSRENFGTKCWHNGFETIWLSGNEAVTMFLLRWS